MTIEEALVGLPERLQRGLRAAFDQGGDMARAMLERGDMPAQTALMAGLALDPVGRDVFEDQLAVFANVNAELPAEYPEVIIGGGAHAAVWATTRTRTGGARPLVLEARERFGGALAMTQRSSFFLNSRNRPGPSGAPGSRDALNVIPGAPMQPSDLSGSEYQTNADAGLVIRCALALNSVIRKTAVTSVAENGPDYVIETDRGVVRTKRVVIATGLGQRQTFIGAPDDGNRVLSFEQLMRRVGTNTFPLRGLRRVAVVGGGDSGRTAVEALTGYGPPMSGSVASVDYVERIDWYGIEAGMTKERWLTCNRTRYKSLAALFPREGGETRNARVRGLPKAKALYVTPDGVMVGNESYDMMVNCTRLTGRAWWQRLNMDEGLADRVLPSYSTPSAFSLSATLGLASEDGSLVVVGPAANLAFDAADPEPRVEENRVALFRLVPRTAALAMRLTPA